MLEHQEKFAFLMAGVRSGSEESVRELLDLYGDHIYRAVRRRLNQQMRSKFDSQDFVQAVWASFFANLPVITHFSRPESLVAFLARVASNKVIDECRRRMQTQKADVTRERSVESTNASPRVSLATTEPSASEVAIANEQWGLLVKGQPPHYRRILELRAKGATNDEIADQLDLSEKTVRRVIRKLIKQLAR